MTITLEPGQIKEVNVHLTPIGVGEPLVVVQQFIGTKDWGEWRSPGYQAYLTLRNEGSSALSGSVRAFDWQQELGERRWESRSFNISPGQIGRMVWAERRLLRDQNAYVRLEVEIGGVKVMDIPPFWFMPGKQWGGAGAVGECYHSEPGLAILWYSQGSETDYWWGWYRHPPPLEGEAIHSGSIPYHRLTAYGDTGMWRAVFLGVFDPGFISGAKYESTIVGCGHCQQAIFQWTQ